MVIPPWICPNKAGGHHSYWFFGRLAVSQQMVTNTYYPGRPSPRAMHDHCYSIFLSTKAGILDPGSAYVVNDEVMAALREGGVTTHRCERVDGFNLCTTIDPLAPPDGRVPVYDVGTLLDFRATGNAAPYMLFGWSLPEPSGTWTVGSEAALLMRLARPDGRALQVIAEVKPFLAPRHRKLDVDIIVNDTIIDQWRFTLGKKGRTRQVLVADAIGDAGMLLRVRFRIWQPTSPASVAQSSDSRPLGLFVHSLRIAFVNSR
jgi:hypothetical protein